MSTESCNNYITIIVGAAIVYYIYTWCNKGGYESFSYRKETLDEESLVYNKTH